MDQILNYMFLDQTVPMKGTEQAFDSQRIIRIARETPIGQTFVTGPETAIVARVRVFLAPTDDWQPGEAAELTIWDSPEKKTRLGSSIIPYENRRLGFPQADWYLSADVAPNTSYYFEITYAGDGDGKQGLIGVMFKNDAYKPGQGYLAGQKADFDLCFQVHSRGEPDRIGNLKRMFSRLDLGRRGLGDVKKAVAQEDFETAIAESVAYFEGRKGKYAIIRAADVPKPQRSDWASKADALMDADWRHVDMEDFGAKKIFCHAYLDTGDEKYAKKINELMIEWLMSSPPPSESHIGGHIFDNMWSLLHNVVSRAVAA